MNEKKEKKKLFGKLNVVDVIIILVVLALVVVFAVNQLTKTPVETNVQDVTFVVVTEGVRKETYEDIAAKLPATLVASGAYASGQVTAVEASPVEVESIEQIHSNNLTQTVTVIPGEDEEFVSLRFTITAPMDLNSLTMELSTQEIRTGREYIVKTAYFELTGTIVSVTRPE